MTKPTTEVLEPIFLSEITCPLCKHRRVETMPTDACQFFYECQGCRQLLRPNKGNCCVFCSFGSLPCPPIQLARQGVGTAAAPRDRRNLAADLDRG